MWRAYDYRTVLETLIANWRRDFMDTELPFLVVQLPGFGCGNALLEGRRAVGRREPACLAVEHALPPLIGLPLLRHLDELPRPEAELPVGASELKHRLDVLGHGAQITAGTPRGARGTLPQAVKLGTP